MNRNQMMKRAQTQKEVNRIFNHPDVQKLMDAWVMEAFAKFALISADYLYRVRGYKKPGIEKFIDFALRQIRYAAKDEEYVPLLNQSFVDELGIDILQRFDIEVKREAEG